MKADVRPGPKPKGPPPSHDAKCRFCEFLQRSIVGKTKLLCSPRYRKGLRYRGGWCRHMRSVKVYER